MRFFRCFCEYSDFLGARLQPARTRKEFSRHNHSSTKSPNGSSLTAKPIFLGQKLSKCYNPGMSLQITLPPQLEQVIAKQAAEVGVDVQPSIERVIIESSTQRLILTSSCERAATIGFAPSAEFSDTKVHNVLARSMAMTHRVRQQHRTLELFLSWPE